MTRERTGPLHAVGIPGVRAHFMKIAPVARALGADPRNIVKSVLPARLRQFLRARHRDFVFWRAMRRLRRNPETAASSSSAVISDLMYGWGNEGCAAREEYLAACVRHALRCAGPILDCGSGLTTIVIGSIAQRSGHGLWALEHSQLWGERATKYLERYHIEGVRLIVCPLKDYGDFSWYDPPLSQLPEGFALVMCDGPPGTTQGGRYGLVPVLRERLSDRSVILLDDAERQEERAIARRWQEELSATHEVLGQSKPYIRILVGQSEWDPE